MKKLILIILISLPLRFAVGQQTTSFIETDTATFRAYINSDWDQIIGLGKVAIRNDIDYYYLRLRMGYAHFMKGQYLLSIPHYKKALEFSNNDPIALEGLFYSYEYSGRENDAEKLVADFPDELKSQLKKTDEKVFTDLGFYITSGKGGQNSLKDSISSSAPSDTEGSQVLPGSFTNFNLKISHRIGRSIIVHHNGHLLNKEEFVYSVVSSVPYISGSQIVRQFNYHVSADITPLQGFTLSPIVSLINYRLPIFSEYGAGTGSDRIVYKYDYHNEKVLGLKGTVNAGLLSFSLSGSSSGLNNSTQKTASSSVTYFPLGNLNLYITVNGFLHFQKQDGNSSDQMILASKIGFSPLKHLWIEAYSTFGDFSNFYDPYSGITYNSPELYKKISSISIIVPLYKSGISVFAGYRHQKSESAFIPASDVFDLSNKKSIKYQSLTIGTLWKI